MPKKPNIENKVYTFVLDHFKTRNADRIANRISRKKTEFQNYPTIESIVNYVLANEKFCESSCCDQKVLGQICASRGTIRKAIKRLIAENKIKLSDDKSSYELNQHMTPSLSKHPILEIADKIDITIGVPENMIVLSVAPEHVMSITKYLTSFFYKGDIIFIPIGGTILCISVFPEEALDKKVSTCFKEKSLKTLRNRVVMALHKFKYTYPQFVYGHNYDFAYHLAHNPTIVEYVTTLAKEIEESRPYSSAESIVASLQETSNFYAEHPSPYNLETDELDIPLGNLTQEDWDLMDSQTMQIVDDELSKYE